MHGGYHALAKCFWVEHCSRSDAVCNSGLSADNMLHCMSQSATSQNNM